MATPEEAIKEYKELEAQWQSHRKLQKTRGMEWKCFQCEKHFPIGGYGDSTQSTVKMTYRNVASLKATGDAA